MKPSLLGGITLIPLGARLLWNRYGKRRRAASRSSSSKQWKSQDRVYVLTEERRKEIGAWQRRRRENPTELEKIIDVMRGRA